MIFVALAHAEEPTNATTRPDAAPAPDPAPPHEKPEDKGDGGGKKDDKKPDGPTVKIGGLVFAHYTVDLTEDKNLANAFDVDRAYFRADAKLNDEVSARITLDANRESTVTVALPATGTGTATGGTIDVPDDTRLRVFVKHAYVEYKPADEFYLRGGLVDTPYLPFEESFEGLRYIWKVFLDDEKLEATADFGVSAGGKVAKGLFSYGVGIYNGEFFTNPEVDTGKSLQARATVDPLATQKGLGLPISAFVDEELHDDPTKPETVAGGLVMFKQDYFVGSAQVDAHLQDGVTGLGESVLIEPRVPDVGYLVGRVDHYDPDGATDSDGLLKIWAGVGHDFLDKVSLAGTFEMAQAEAKDAIPTQGVWLRMQAGF